MSGILQLKDLNRGNIIKQGDKTVLSYELVGVDVSGKSAVVKLMTIDFLHIAYETTATVNNDNQISFTIDEILRARPYYLEIAVDGKHIFPSRSDEGKLSIDKSSLGTEANIIEIVGVDKIVNKVLDKVDTDVSQAITDLETTNQTVQEAEAGRVSAESSRTSAEAQRKIDHANRSAELAGKADKVVIKNLIVNGDVDDTFILNESSYIGITNEGTLSDRGHHSTRERVIEITNGHIYYVNANFTQGAVRERVYLRYEDASAEDNGASLNLFPQISTTIKANFTKKANLKFYSSAGTYIKDYVMMIDLTQTFGAGNEPTKEEMDELIKVTGYINGEYALNNKEMLIWILALIRRNTNAIVALGGA